MVCLFCCRKIVGPIVGIYKSLRNMNVNAAQFLFWAYIKRIFFAVWPKHEKYRWNAGVVDKPRLGDAGRRMPAAKASGAADHSAN